GTQGSEQLFRVARIRTNVVIPEDDGASWAGRDLPDDLVDGTIAHRPRPIKKRDRTVVTTMRASSCRNRYGLAVAASFDEIPSRCRHARQRRCASRNINGLELTPTSVFEHTRPGILSLADHNGVGVKRGFLRQRRRVGPPDNNRHAPTTKF